MFDQFDADKDGFITHQEMSKMISDGKVDKMSEKQAKLMVRKLIKSIHSYKLKILLKLSFKIKFLDQNGDGKIDLNEFDAMLQGNIFDITKDENIKRFFKVFDTNNSGYISKEDLKEIVEVIGEKVDDKEIEQAIQKADTNSDGKINYEGDYFNSLSQRILFINLYLKNFRICEYDSFRIKILEFKQT